MNAKNNQYTCSVSGWHYGELSKKLSPLLGSTLTDSQIYVLNFKTSFRTAYRWVFSLTSFIFAVELTVFLKSGFSLPYP